MLYLEIFGVRFLVLLLIILCPVPKVDLLLFEVRLHYYWQVYYEKRVQRLIEVDLVNYLTVLPTVSSDVAIQPASYELIITQKHIGNRSRYAFELPNDCKIFPSVALPNRSDVITEEVGVLAGGNFHSCH